MSPRKKSPGKPDGERKTSRGGKGVASKALPRKTTEVEIGDALTIERPAPVIARGSASEAPGSGALSRFGAGWSLEAGYEAWDALREAHRSERARLADERRRLEDQGRFLLGAVRAASAPTSPPEAPGASALAPLESLPEFLRQTEASLAAARSALEERESSLARRLADEESDLRKNLIARVKRFAESTRPRLVLWLRPVGATRRILHVERVAPEESLILLHAFTAKIPSRYGFLFDEATEDLSLPPPPLYVQEGVHSDQVRPSASALRERLESASEVLPIRTFLPLFVPRPDGEKEFFRLLQRGAVMEVEIAEGDAFRNVLTAEEAERFAGALLRLKLAGRIELELKA